MKNLFVSIAILLGTYTAQAVELKKLPAGTVITINQKVLFEIGSESSTVYADSNSYLYAIAKPIFVETGLIINSPIVMTVSSVKQMENYSGYLIMGTFNKESLKALNFYGTATIENFMENMAKAGITVVLPAPFEE